MPYNELEHYYSWTTISIATFLKSAEANLRNPFDDDIEIAKNQILGGAIVTHISRMEYELGKKQNKPWPGIDKHYGKEEFLNFTYIRHCYAHAGGKLLENRKNNITNFLAELKAGHILDHEDIPIIPYYEIDDRDFLKLDNSSIARLSTLCKELLALNGKIEMKLVHSKADWSNGKFK